MITDRIGRHEVLLPINHNYDKICDFCSFFLNIKTQEITRVFARSGKKKAFKCARPMVRTVQLLRHDSYCPISSEIRRVDSQSDLRILF